MVRPCRKAVYSPFNGCRNRRSWRLIPDGESARFYAKRGRLLKRSARRLACSQAGYLAFHNRYQGESYSGYVYCALLHQRYAF